jgi:Transglycosylase SLT domain
MRRWVAWLSLLLLVCGGAAAQAPDWTVCDRAAEVTEQRFGLPSGLLASIGLVESGRPDPQRQQVPWPWTVQAEGTGRFLPDAATAADAVADLQRRGVTSIDVGCFQVNLYWHKGAFATLAEAFDPYANAAAAASFLLSLRGQSGSWDGAVAAYHSATVALGQPYRDRVLAAWHRDDDAPPELQTPGLQMVVWRPATTLHVWGPAPLGTAPAMIVIAAPSR